MINSFNKYEVVVVKFPFASSLKYKARPAVIISSHFYNQNSRDTLLILAISSQIDQKLSFEIDILEWHKAVLLKPSLFKSAIATIQSHSIIQKLGMLSDTDCKRLDTLLNQICS